jgi:hypothetical protein
VIDTIPGGQTITGSVNSYGCDNDTYIALLGALLGDAGAPSTPMTTGHSIKTYTIEKKIPDGTGGYEYIWYRGCTPTRATINITPNEPVTWDFDFVGGKTQTGQTALTGATYTAPTPNPQTAIPFNSSEATLSFGSANMGMAAAPEYTTASLVLDANMREVDVIDPTSAGIGRNVVQGRLKCTLDVSVLFQNMDAYDYLTDPATAIGTCVLSLLGSGSATGSIVFTFGRAKPSAMSVVATGTGQEVLSNITVELIADQTGSPEQCSIAF